MTPMQSLISYAQEYLKKQPFDIVHDFEHHQLVYQNCLRIITEEKLEPDLQAIEVAAWWHDVEKSYKTSNSADSTIEFLRKTASELNLNEALINSCCQVVGEHSYSQSQTTLESKILFDADKIEYVNDLRIKKLVDHFSDHPELYDAHQLARTREIWLERVAVVADRMHFGYSRNKFNEKLPATHQILDRYYSQLIKMGLITPQ